MSAFLVSRDVLDSVKRLIEEHGLPGYSRPILLTELADLNAQAMRERYGLEETDDEVREWRASLLQEQKLKDLHCFMYQCSEGNVPETKLYRELHALQVRVDTLLSYGSPRYEAAVWGR